jgi:hypothetical protein
MKKTSTLLLTSLIFLAACKKNHDKSAADMVSGKWKVSSLQETHTSTADTVTYPYTGQSADYMDFRSDGKMYSFYDNYPDTIDYKVLSDKYLLLGGDSMQIKTLSDASLTLYLKYTDGYYSPVRTIEVTYNLKK